MSTFFANLYGNGCALHTHKLLKSLKTCPLIIVCGRNPNRTNLKNWENSEAEVIKIDSSEKEIDLKALMIVLAQKGINSLLVEGGGKIAKSLLEKQIIGILNFLLEVVIQKNISLNILLIFQKKQNIL